jgi:hypothetical protein
LLTFAIFSELLSCWQDSLAPSIKFCTICYFFHKNRKQFLSKKVFHHKCKLFVLSKY